MIEDELAFCSKKILRLEAKVEKLREQIWEKQQERFTTVRELRGRITQLQGALQVIADAPTGSEIGIHAVACAILKKPTGESHRTTQEELHDIGDCDPGLCVGDHTYVEPKCEKCGGGGRIPFTVSTGVAGGSASVRCPFCTKEGD